MEGPAQELMQERRIDVQQGLSVSASIFGNGAVALVLGHGAGGTRKTPFMVRVAEALAAGSRRVVLFNFPYSENGRRVPDPPPLLEATVAAAAQWSRSQLGAQRLVLGGKSMGGRIASQAVAKGLAADALVFLGYALHPPGKPEKLRDAHLPAVAAPMLFVQGTRDAFARWDLLEATLGKLGERATLLKIEDGDHSFKVPKTSGRTTEEVEATVRRAVLDWLTARGL